MILIFCNLFDLITLVGNNFILGATLQFTFQVLLKFDTTIVGLD